MTRRLWSIKYRPKTLGDYIFKNEAHKELVQSWIDSGSIPHLLLKGHRGTGKTALAYLIKDLLEIDDTDFLVLNSSDENSVDVVRTKVKNFVSTVSMGDIKIVFLDEADYMTHNAQAALKNMMEEYSDNARFILTCNKPSKIIPELKSRCQELEYTTLDKDQIIEKAALILTEEKVKANLDDLEAYVDANYPDFRKIIESLDQHSKDGKLAPFDDANDSFNDYELVIVDMIENDNYVNLRTKLSESVSDNEWEDVYKFLYDNLHELGKFKDDFDKWSQGIVIIADHLYRNSVVSDPEINGAAMFIRLGSI